MKQKHLGICASGIVVRNDDKILIVKRSDIDDFLPGYWELPGGGMEYGEQPDEAIQREIYEECGLTISNPQPFVVTSYVGYENTPREKQYIEIFYMGDHTAGEDVTISFEHSDYQWVDVDGVSDIYMTDYIKDIFKRLETHPRFANNS